MSTFIKYRNHQLIGNASTPVVFSASSDHTLTNPCPSYVQANFTVAGQNLILPSMVEADSLSLGESIVIENIGYESFTIKKSDGITDVYVDFPPTARMQFYLSDVIDPEGNFVYTNAINAERVVLKYEAGTYQVDPTTDLGVTLFLHSPAGVLTLLTIGNYPDDFFFYVKSEVGHAGSVTPFPGQTIDSRSVLNVTGLEGYKIFKAYNSSNVPNWYIQAQMIPPGSAVEYDSLTLTIPLAPSSGGTGINNGGNTLTIDANSTIDQDVSTTGTPTFASVTSTGTIASGTSTAGVWQSIGVSNSDNSNSGSRASFRSTVGGASAGDPNAVFTVAGVQDWSIGVDNSDGDKLKFDTTDTPGTGTVMSLDTSGNLNLPILTASSAVATDASKNLVSVANVGTGSNALVTTVGSYSPTIGNGSGTNFTTSLANGGHFAIAGKTFFWAHIDWSGKNGLTTESLVLSLPSAPTAADRISASIGYANGMPSGAFLMALCQESTAGLDFYKIVTGTTSGLVANDVTASGSIYISGWYY